MESIYRELGIQEAIFELVQAADLRIADRLTCIRSRAERRQYRVLRAFQQEEVAYRHFAPTTGYGYDDIGRDTLERLYARCFGAEDAIVRPHIASGTHALALCLQGLLGKGEGLLSASGTPYDTLEEVIGLRPARGSLLDWGITYRQVELTSAGCLDIPGVVAAVRAYPEVRVVYVQRSRGYAWRRSLSVTEIGALAREIHALNPQIVVAVDNCYGEFVDEWEPTELGADVIVGSLIKNPGGGLAPTGGYIAGKKELIEQIGYRLTAPGIGREVGSWAASYAPFYQGLFLAPHVVGECLQGAMLTAEVMRTLGFEVLEEAERGDIIQAIRFQSAEQLIAFCQGIQKASPVDSYVVPEPWDMPGYACPVIMAAGTFVQGASIELSIDAPVQPPYIAYMQGGLTYAHVKIGLMTALTELARKGLLLS